MAFHDDTPKGNSADGADDFAQQAEGAAGSIVREFWDFLKCNKKWWLLPILVALLLVGVFVVLSSSAAAPLIYTLF